MEDFSQKSFITNIIPRNIFAFDFCVDNMAFSSNPLFATSSGLGYSDHDDFPPPIVDISETGWYVRVKETNYQRDQVIPVQGKMSIGELTLKVVEEIGRKKSFHKNTFHVRMFTI